MEIPVYLFLGFLESGKTKFIQEILETKEFNSGEKTLLLLCEEGIEEYNPSKFYGKNVYIKNIESLEDFTSDNLSAWCKEVRAERVVIEYNGMWAVNELTKRLPRNFLVYQTITFVNAQTIKMYNDNMRALVVDKLTIPELVVFNRYNDSINKNELHQIVRSTGSRSDIMYEYEDGSAVPDDIEDPLPFDIDAPIIRLTDESYAYWYQDIMENPEKYDGKTVRFKGIATVDKESLDVGGFIIGRHVMTCCEDDIFYAGILCLWDKSHTVRLRDWFRITADISFEHNKLYGGKGPVLYATSVEQITEPEQQLVTF